MCELVMDRELLVYRKELTDALKTVGYIPAMEIIAEENVGNQFIEHSLNEKYIPFHQIGKRIICSELKQPKNWKKIDGFWIA